MDESSSSAVQSLPAGCSGLLSMGLLSSIRVSLVATSVSAGEVTLTVLVLSSGSGTRVVTVALAVSLPSGKVLRLTSSMLQPPPSLTVVETVTGSPDSPRTTMVTISPVFAPLEVPSMVTWFCSVRLIKPAGSVLAPSNWVMVTSGPWMSRVRVSSVVLPALSVTVTSRGTSPRGSDSVSAGKGISQVPSSPTSTVLVVSSGNVTVTVPPGSPLPLKVGRLMAVALSSLEPVLDESSSSAVQSLVPVGLSGPPGSTGSLSMKVSLMASLRDSGVRTLVVDTATAVAVSCPSGAPLTSTVVVQLSLLAMAMPVLRATTLPSLSVMTTSTVPPGTLVARPLTVTVLFSASLMKPAGVSFVPSKTLISTPGSIVIGSSPEDVLPAGSVTWTGSRCSPLGRPGTPDG